ncbi:hypothetical protein F8998_06360 [Campylobacter coli]|nr:hypothetical protein [Campylobacter coli]EAJ1635328.1 hypothetical protein [Campylobacter coli]EAJ2704365.1 hypothetical protein [Campylobacter coli]EAJ8453905.1 hypothetical protein [Campylobacter coli]EAJ9904507.1 hypothetical protein [Campylobacter coli]
MTATDIREIFEKKLREKTQNQKVIVTKGKNERPHNGSSREISDFLLKLDDKDFMKKEIEQASDQVISLAKEHKNV